MQLQIDETEEEKRRRKKAAIVLLLAAAVFLLGALAWYLPCGKQAGNFSGGVEFNAKSVTTGKKAEDLPKEVTISGIGEIKVNAGETQADVLFTNPDENKGAYYLTFELTAEIGGRAVLLYSSGLVEPGKSMSSIELSRPLDKGEYKAVVHVQPYLMDKGLTPTNNADIVTKLVAE